MRAYTLATYRVLAGREDQFMEAWGRLADIFSSLAAPPYWGTLIRSTTDRLLFHSFGPWEDAADVSAMRSNPQALQAFKTIGQFCETVTPGDYEIVIHIKVRDDFTEG